MVGDVVWAAGAEAYAHMGRREAYYVGRVCEASSQDCLHLDYIRWNCDI